MRPRLILCAALMGVVGVTGCKPKVEMAASRDTTLGGGGGGGAAMASMEANKATMRRFYDEVLNMKKMDVIDSIAASNMIEHNPPPGAEASVAGLKKAMTEFTTAFPDLHTTVDLVVAEGDLVTLRSTMTGTMKGDLMGMKATNKSFKITAIDICRFKDGKAVEHWGNEDDMAMMQQVGLAPSMDAPPPSKDAPSGKDAPKSKK